MKLFCQTFSKTCPTPPEKPLHLRSQSRSCFWKSRSPAKQAQTSAARRGRRLFPRAEAAGTKAAVKSERARPARSQGRGHRSKRGKIDGSDRPATGGGAASPVIVLPVCQSMAPRLQYYPPRPSIHHTVTIMYSKHLAGGAPRRSHSRSHHARRRVCLSSRRCLAASPARACTRGSQSSAEHRRRRRQALWSTPTARAGRGFSTRPW